MIFKNIKNKNTFFSQSRKGGYSMIELLFYIALFTIVAIAVINSMITMTKAFRETAIQSELGSSSVIVERISREIRQASNINSISSNNLQLATTDENGVAKTVQFVLSSSDVQLYEDGVFTGNLNSPNITVTALTFSQITTTAGKAVKVSLSLSSDNDVLSRTLDFYNTIVLRGQY
jgi:type II secretory pathway pseudopilin PulG